MLENALFALFMVACGNAVPVGPDDVVSRTDVTQMGLLEGVTIAPETGARIVLASDALYALDGQQILAQPPDIGFPYTDLAALGDGVVALSTRSDGYLFGTTDGSFVQHFCYEPAYTEDPEQWEEQFQVTDALAFDPSRGLIIAQPRTAGVDDPGNPTESFVATYDAPTGQDLEWFSMPRPGYRAGGLAVAPSGDVWLGRGDRLDRFGPGMDRPERLASLGAIGIESIEGLAIDEGAETLLVADADGEIVEIRLDAVE